MEKSEKNETTNHQITASGDANEERKEKILKLSDRLLEKISLAIDELSLFEATQKVRTKEVTYDEESKKVIKETNTEQEMGEVRQTLIDTASLKQLVSTLKDIKDIHTGYDGIQKEQNEQGVVVISDIIGQEEGL